MGLWSTALSKGQPLIVVDDVVDSLSGDAIGPRKRSLGRAGVVRVPDLTGFARGELS